MRKRMTRVTALALAALLAVPPAASASQALGTEIHLGQTQLAEGVNYTRQYLWSATYSDLRTERYIEYTPNDLVQPAVAYGETVLDKNTLSELAQALEDDGMRVIGGLNGDYFVVATGAPLGMVVTDGILRSSSSYHHALGFDSDGNAFIGKPELSVTATFGDSTYAVSGGLNKVRTESGGYVLYSDDYNETTNHSSPGIDVILTPSTKRLGKQVKVDLDIVDAYTIQNDTCVMTIKDTLTYSDVPMIGSRISCTVEEVLYSEKSIEIPEGSLVLSINNNSDAWLVSQLASLREGDSVDIDIIASDDQWEDAVTAVGGLYKMVTDGVVESGLETAQAPRSAVGIRPDGSTVFYSVDGRQSGYSVGASMQQVAERLVELGCVEAVCMDGGGSTTLGASLPGSDQFDVLNQPSDGSQRAVSNALFLVAEQDSPGKAKHLIVSPGDAIMLSGAELELSAFSIDNLGQTVREYRSGKVDYELPEEAGFIEDDILIAGDQAGTYTLEASVGSLDGTALITVVPSPSQITVHTAGSDIALSTLHLEPGETIDLEAAAHYRNLPLICQTDNFTWEVTEGVATIDEDGVLTAARTNGTGTIYVTAGDRTVSIPLTVSGHIDTVENFEGDFFDPDAEHLAALMDAEQRSAYVRYGKQSARVTYDLNAAEFAAVSTDLDLREGEAYLNFWVYGDGSGNTLSAQLALEDDDDIEQILTVLNFTGWQQITTTLPEGVSQIHALKIAPTGSSTQGIFWLDQFTSSNQYVPDNTAPAVAAELLGSTLTATLQDNMDESFSAAQISVTYDGQEIPFKLKGMTLTAELPEPDDLLHRVTVTATDASGNIGRASLDITPTVERENPFDDMEEHWALNYVNYLYDHGVTNGLVVGEELHFQPDKAINRGEFALMVTRWLRLDNAEYSDVELPFADLADIPAWCLDGIKAAYALGIMQGSAENGATYALPSRSITRAEALTMLGRIQEKGYALAELTFTDADSIPAWATEYVASLVAQGAISGNSDNTFTPNTYIKRCEIAKILYTMR